MIREVHVSLATLAATIVLTVHLLGALAAIPQLQIGTTSPLQINVYAQMATMMKILMYAPSVIRLA